MPETVIRPAVDAQRLSVDLIRQHHGHLAEARILWLTTTAKRKRADKSVLATSSRLDVVKRYLSSGDSEDVEDGYDFLILISASTWRSLTPAQQLALVDHQLCRCGQRVHVNRRTGAQTETWCTLSPDVEEFSGVIRRHGLWLTAQKNFAEAIPRQMKLDDEPETPPAQHKRRRTTAEPDGIVVSTEVEDAEHAAKNAETAERLSGLTHFVGDDCDPPHADLPQDEGATNGVEHEPGWQEKTGIGSTEHEKRRRGRARAESS